MTPVALWCLFVALAALYIGSLWGTEHGREQGREDAGQCIALQSRDVSVYTAIANCTTRPRP